MASYSYTNLQVQSPWIAGQTFTVGAFFNLASTNSSAGVANGDTITALGLIPEGGVEILSVLVTGAEMDSNSSPSGTFSLGDTLSDSNAAARYILGASLGTNLSNAQLVQYQNVAPTVTDGAWVKGVGYVYNTNQNSNANAGDVSAKLTVTASPATAATSGYTYLYITYACVGNS